MPKNKNTCIYVVKQYQPQEGYNGEIIYTYMFKVCNYITINKGEYTCLQ